MKPCPNEIVLYMHDYLDGEISYEHEQLLKEHLQKCEDCQKHFHELKKTIAFVKSTANIEAPIGFTQSVMARLPKEKKKVGMNRWLRHHPFLVAASLFIVLMAGSIVSSWSKDQNFSFTKQPNLVVENHTVIVPEGEVIKGDIVVKNGDIRIEGEVQGDITVINGEKYMASAGNVTGEIETINQIFDWIWYKMKSTAKEVVELID